MGSYYGRKVGVVSEHGDAYWLYPGGNITLIEALPATVMLQVSGDIAAAVTTTGDVYVSGHNSSGMLGIGAPRNTDEYRWTHVPRELLGGIAVVQVALGRVHSVVLGADGGVFTTGCASSGRLGHGDQVHRTVFTRVAALASEKVVMVAAGDNASAMVGEGGGVFVCGHNSNGELGTGDRVMRLTPERIKDFSTAKTVHVSMRLACVAVQTDDTMYVWGHGGYGQLGLGDLEDRVQPQRICCGRDDEVLGPIVSAVCGVKNTLALTKTGAVWWCGATNNRNKQTVCEFVRVERMPPAVQVVAGRGTDAGFVSAAGELYAWSDLHVGGPPRMRWKLRVRVGIYNHRFARRREVAFAMLAHARLGAESAFGSLPSELVRRVLDTGVSWPSGPLGERDGLARLLGGAHGHVTS